MKIETETSQGFSRTAHMQVLKLVLDGGAIGSIVSRRNI